MNVAEAVGRGLVAHGISHVFGVVGSGNFHVTNALIANALILAVTSMVWPVVSDTVTSAETGALARISVIRLLMVVSASVAKVAVKLTPLMTQVAVAVVGGVKMLVAWM